MEINIAVDFHVSFDVNTSSLDKPKILRSLITVYEDLLLSFNRPIYLLHFF